VRLEIGQTMTFILALEPEAERYRGERIQRKGLASAKTWRDDSYVTLITYPTSRGPRLRGDAGKEEWGSLRLLSD